MKRAICLIDGFNLYHAISNRFPPSHKWCNYRKLVEQFLAEDEQLGRVIYFSAFARWDLGKVSRHSTFISALRHFNVETRMGKFKKKNIYCKKCLQRFPSHEEKESDVNIAVALVSMAYKNEFDVALLVSGDSDFVSTVKFIRAEFPEKRVGVIVPGDVRMANDLRNAAHFNKGIDKKHVQDSLMPASIELDDGTVIKCPNDYLI